MPNAHRPALFVALDLFHAGAYGDWSGDPLRERDCFYLVLQPFLRRRAVTVGGTEYSSPSLTDYFTGWRAEHLQEPGVLVVLNEDFDHRDPTQSIGGDGDLVPVPFPPDTRLSCTVTAGGEPTTVQRIVGRRADPFDLTGSWTEFATRNGLSTPATEWADFSEAQQSSILDWAYGLKVTYEGGRPEDLSQHEESEIIPLLAAAPKERRVSRAEHAALHAGRTAAAYDPDPFRTHMTAGDPPPVATLLRLCRAAEAHRSQRLRPPTYQLSTGKIAEKTQHDETVLFPEATYHRWLWAHFRDAFRDAQLRGESDEAHERLGDVLQRFFAFGERLEYPARTGAERHLMRVAPEAAATGGWTLTNAHSLAEQVFRFGPFENPASLEWSDPAIRIEELRVETARHGVGVVIAGMWAEVESLGPDPFSGLLERDPDHPRGRVWFFPRHGRCADTKIRLEGGTRSVLSIPGALLDAVDPTPRQESPPGRHELVVVNPQPVVLREEHLFSPDTLRAHPDVRRMVRVKMLLERVPLVSGSEPVYRATVVEPLGTADAEYLQTLLRAADTSADLSAALWVERAPQSIAEQETVPVTPFALQGQVLEVVMGTAPGAAPGVVLRDRGRQLTDLLPRPRGAGSSEPPPPRYPVDFVCDAPAETDPFNLLALRTDDPPPVTLMLRDVFEHRVTRSAERLLERYGYRLVSGNAAAAVAPEYGADSIVAAHAENFNKLSLSLESADAPPRTLTLTERDALLPLPGESETDGRDPSEVALPEDGHPFSYWIAHHFSQEVREEPKRTEDAHFATVRDAGTEWTLRGTVEHQYGHRFGVRGTRSLRFGLSTDARSLAAVSLKPPASDAPAEPAEPAETAETETPRTPAEKLDALYALVFDHRRHGGGDTIELRLNRAYIEELVEQLDAPGGTPARLRDLYEALIDLVRAERATLHLDCFVVDNTRGEPHPADIADPDTVAELSSLARNLRCVVSSGTAFPLDDPVAVRWAALVDGDFAAFEGALRATAAGGRALFDPIVVPLARWNLGGRPREIHRWANVIRLGLEVTRPTERTIAWSADGGSPLPAEESFALIAMRRDGTLPGEIASDPMYTALDRAQQSGGGIDDLRARAREELERYLGLGPGTRAASPLHRAFAWIASEDCDHVEKLEQTDDPARARRIFGEAYRFLNFPTGFSDGRDTVVGLFYVLFGFRPTATHPALGDARTTFEFAQYLVTLLGAIANGNQAAVEELLALDGNADTEQAWKHRAEARRILAEDGATRSVVSRIFELLWRVDPQETSAWGGEPTVRKTPRYDHVDRALRAVEEEAKRVLRALLEADPALYAWGKAIALGVFDPDSYAKELYALQITKHIREKKPPASVPDPQNLPDTDTDRFTLSRFFGKGANRFVVDVLDDHSYDNEFQIHRAVFRGEDYEAAPGARRRGDMQARGSTLARSGEDLIEQRHHFHAETLDLRATGPRSIEADVVHYNPEWRYTDEGSRVHELYLLPSRLPPRTPTVLRPADAEAHRTQLDLELGGAPDEPVNLDAQLVAFLDGLPKSIDVAPAQGAEVSERMESFADRLLARGDHGSSAGWWYQDAALEHHFFLVETDEEGSIANDAFEVVLERARSPFPEDTAAAAPRPKLDDPLFRWFQFHRRREEAAKTSGSTSDPAALEVPSRMPLPEVLEKVERWLRPPGDREQSLLAPLPLELGSGLRDDGIDRFVSVFATAGGASLEVMERPDDGAGRTPANPPLGSIVAVEAMRMVQRKDGAWTERDRFVALHVVVLASCSRHSRVRLRVLRNVRDRKRDHTESRQPELNRAFLMRSSHSPWSSLGRVALQRDYAEAVREGEPVSPLLSPLEPAAPSFDEWLDPAPATYDLGAVVEETVTRTVLTTYGRRVSLWDEAELRDPRYTVRGVVLQHLPDHHVRVDVHGNPAPRVPAREDYVARQLLAKRSASTLHWLFAGENEIRKHDVRTARPLLRLTWTGPTGGPMLEVTWPIRWRS